MLDNRKKRVLQAIIEEYITTAEPVSSSTVVNNYGLEYSSATIRNDMVDLEELGLLDKPHTSAGRVPSNKGYRLYVDELIKEDDISMNEMQYVKQELEARVNEMIELTNMFIETTELVKHMLKPSFTKDIDVYIENENETLEDFSIVAFKHGYDNKDMEITGGIEPARMDYSKIISIMKYMRGEINGRK